MCADTARICILVLTITSTLHLSSVNGFTATQSQTQPQPQAQTLTTSKTSPTSVDAVEAQISLTPTLAPIAKYEQPTTTTTTLASSNALATTIEAAISRTHEIHDDDDKIEEFTAAVTAATMLPEILDEEASEQQGEPTIRTSSTETTSTKTTTMTTTATKQGEATTSSDGNEVKTQIKSTEREMKTKQQQQQVQQQVQLPTTMNAAVEEENANEQETTTMANIMAEATKTETLQDTAAVEMSTVLTTTMTTTTTPTPTPTTSTNDELQQQQHNHMNVEGRTKSSLHQHITPSEVVVTDEFGTQPDTSNAAETIKTKADDVSSGAATKVNIADLYPMKKEDFEPIIRDSNTKLLKERTVFKKLEDDAEYRQNLLPNEVETNELSQQQQRQQQQQQPQQHSQNVFASDVPNVPRPQHLPTLELTLMSRDGSDDDGTVSDFTGKLLAEQDGIITEIEQKFRLSEFVPTTSTTTTTSTTMKATKNVLTTLNGDITTANPTTFKATEKPTGTSSRSNGDINHQLFKANTKGTNIPSAAAAHDFIERRVKKSFAFPMHRAASDAMSAPYVDFANTKFTGSIAGNGSPAVKAKTLDGDVATPNGGNASPHDGGLLVTGAAHPEFSTTKFYNSKELYNEMVMHNKLRQLQSKPAGTNTADETHAQGGGGGGVGGSGSSNYATTMLPGAASRFATLKNVKNFFVSGEPLRAASMSSTELGATAIKQVTLAATTTATLPVLAPQSTATTTLKPKKFQKELKRAKLLLKAMLTPSTAATAAAAPAAANPTKASSAAIVSSIPAASTSAPSSLIVQAVTSAPVATTALSSLGALSSATTSALPSLATKTTTKTSTTTTTTNAGTVAQPFNHAPLTTIAAASQYSTLPQQLRATNPTKSASKPIARPRVLSRLQEKINSLECEIQNVPQDSHLWRGNETHELLLPIVTSKNCNDNKQQQQQQQADCYASSSSTSTSTSSPALSWDGEAEIQSGDILIVEINDALLMKVTSNITSAHNTQVYQVTRSGHEHCDVTEGILLDITPLVVDGRKLVTLYDKDLTEGVNLLIVVSELWGAQCVRLKVTTKTDNCGENADCSGKGVCYSNPNMEEYECQCCTGFAGPHCEEIDACTPSPCTNNGICVDLSQGHEGNSYQCLCPYGYTGKNCQYESDPCNPAECMNGGTCVGNSTHFRCDCTSGFAGPLCQHSLNECESSPCVHGICVDQEDGFRCFCQPGFAGELCNFEYNECESNPCQNGGECIDHIGSYECRCTKGYTGVRCQKKVDFCANKPCPEGHRCIDHGNDFSCECPGGRNGPDCNQMARTRCNVNPCTHGGTCWSSGDSFYCACRPGFTGTMCEDEFVVETVVSSSEFIVDDTSTRNFNDKSFGSSVVLKSPIELHSAYFAAGVLAAASFIVAVVVTICHCKVNQTYRKFSTRTTSFIPIIGFGRRPKPQSKLNKHWLSGKGLVGSGANMLRSTNTAATSTRAHANTNSSSGGGGGSGVMQNNNVGQLHERPFQRHLAMNLENDMYYTVDFSENSQHSPLIQ